MLPPTVPRKNKLPNVFNPSGDEISAIVSSKNSKLLSTEINGQSVNVMGADENTLQSFRQNPQQFSQIVEPMTQRQQSHA